MSNQDILAQIDQEINTVENWINQYTALRATVNDEDLKNFLTIILMFLHNKLYQLEIRHYYYSNN